MTTFYPKLQRFKYLKGLLTSKMNFIYDKNVLSAIIKANIFILLSCLAVGVTEYLYCVPVYINYNATFADYISLFLYSIGFYSILHLFIVIVIDIIIIVSSYLNNKKRYYFFILSFIFSLLNIIPFYIVASFFLKGFSNNTFLYILLTLVLSICISSIISLLIVNSFNDFMITAKKYTLIIFIFFIVLIGAVFSISDKIVDSNQYLLTYYLILLLIFYFLTFFNYYIAFQEKSLFIIKYKYLLIPAIIAIIFTVISFPSNLKLEAMVKKFIPFENNIINYISQLLDFDRDGFGPEYIISGGDKDNLNSKINPYMKDIPENLIDENGINGDLNKSFIDDLNTGQSKIINVNIQNIILITIDNIDVDEEIQKKEGYLTELINKGVYFPKAISVSKNKVMALNGLFNSNLKNIEKLNRKKQLLQTTGSIFSLYNSKNYSTHAFLDIPYSVINDIFDLTTILKTLYVNNNKMEYPISTQNVLEILHLFKNTMTLSWIYFDNKIPVSPFIRIKNLFEALNNNKLIDKCLMIIILIPESSDKDNNNYYTSPILFYYNGINPKMINKRISYLDILPTLNSLTGISNKNKGYTGIDLRETVISNKPLNKRPITSINGDGSVITVIYDNYKLIYSIKAGFYEIYNLKKDPGQVNNLINTDEPEFAKLFYWLDFFLANGSSS